MNINEFKTFKDYTRKPKACGPSVFKRINNHNTNVLMNLQLIICTADTGDT